MSDNRQSISAKKPPFKVSTDDMQVAIDLMSEICAAAVWCEDKFRDDICTRAAVVTELLRQIRMNAKWTVEQDSHSEK